MLGTSASSTTVARSLDIAVLVGPVRVPAYLERSQIASLAGDGEIRLDEFNRWLGGFKENFLRALSLGLARELGSTRIVSAPSHAPFEFDYRIRLHVDDLISSEGEGLRVRLRWALVPVSREGSTKLFVMDEVLVVEGGSVEGLVRAYDDAIDELVRRIAGEVVELESDD
jgi:uncharacterized lipoprotein YmbA